MYYLDSIKTNEVYITTGGPIPINIDRGRVGKMQMDKLVEDRKKVATLLQKVLEGSLSAAESLKRWPETEEDLSIKSVKHAIEHFIVDEDIRKNDKTYDKKQIDQLRRFMERLAEGENIDEREIGWFTPRNVGPLTLLKKFWETVIKRLQRPV